MSALAWSSRNSWAGSMQPMQFSAVYRCRSLLLLTGLTAAASSEKMVDTAFYDKFTKYSLNVMYAGFKDFMLLAGVYRSCQD